jgi:hypothetical protein
MCPSTSAFTCGFNSRTLQHITIAERVSGCPEIVLDAELVAEVKLQFSELHAQQQQLRGFSPQANYNDRATAACRRS